MGKKQKFPWILIYIIIGLIFIVWILNLKYVLQQGNGQDSFIFLIKNSVLEISKSFKSISNELNIDKWTNSSTVLTDEELQRLKEKILQEDAKKEITK